MSEHVDLAAVPEEFRAVVDFHGHVCPGLVLATRLTQAAMERLGVRRHDHSLQAIVESGRCPLAPVQWFTGCMGTRRLIVKDWGRTALTLLHRKTGKAVRARIKPGFPPPEIEALGFEERFFKLLEIPAADYVLLEDVRITETLPTPGRPTQIGFCQGCGERVLDGTFEEAGGKKLCLACRRPYFERA